MYFRTAGGEAYAMKYMLVKWKRMAIVVNTVKMAGWIWILCLLQYAAHAADSQALIESGNALFHANKYAEAAQAYQQAVQADPKNRIGYEKLGFTLITLGKFDEAIIAYRQAVALQPELMENQQRLASLLRLSGRPHEAIVVLEQAIEINPASAGSYLLLGKYSAYQGDLTKGYQACYRAATLDPESFVTHSCLGMILTAQGKYDEAVSAYQESIRMFPNTLLSPGSSDHISRAQARLPLAFVYYQLSLTLAMMHKAPDAVDAYDHALQIVTACFSPPQSLSTPFFPVDLLYGQSVLSDEHFALPHKHLGFALRELGHPQKAILVLQYAKHLLTSMEPQNEEAIQEIDLVLNQLTAAP